MSFDATNSIDSIPWDKAPGSESGMRAFARRYNFYPRRTNSGEWSVCWSSYGDHELYDSAIEAIREEIKYRRWYLTVSAYELDED